MPTKELLSPLLMELHEKSRRMTGIAPIEQWTQQMKTAWSLTTGEFAKRMKTALDNETELELTQMIIDLLGLPYRTLTQMLPSQRKKTNKLNFNHNDPKGSEAAGSRIHREVEKLAKQDRMQKAMQRLLSNGSAGNSEKVFQIMKEMHPERKEELKKHPQIVKQVHISTKAASRFLYNAAKQDKSCPGAFGWSANWLLPIRGLKNGPGRTTFLHQIARLTARIGNAQVPDIIAFALTCGGIFALNKLPPEEQMVRETKGLKPKLRPVNVGCAILKWAFKLAIMTKQARDAIVKLAPIQMGLKAAHGVEVVGHLFRSIWELGHVIITTDYSNGFNAFERQAMLDAVNKKCPGLNALFSKYYALDSMCFFRTDAETKIIWSKQGSRMGCVMGSFGFDLTVDDIYDAVSIKFPDVVVKALTDDLTIGVKPPESEEDMDNFWEKNSSILKFIAEESRRVAGLELNFSKCHCLAPAKLRDPKPGMLPKGTNLERNGIRLAGAPIGTD